MIIVRYDQLFVIVSWLLYMQTFKYDVFNNCKNTSIKRVYYIEYEVYHFDPTKT